MALQNLPGAKQIFIGPNPWITQGAVAVSTVTMDAANEATIMIGRVETSDGGSHTIDTSGSSSIQWRTGAVTFANAGTTLKVGIAPVDTGAGPPARASNASDVIALDVSKSLTGGGGLVTANAWQTHVPDTGTKTIANGDLVAICIQATARAGADSVVANLTAVSTATQRPAVTSFTGGAYASVTAMPNALIVFADGALGWINFSDIASTLNTRTWNSGSATKEYGQLFNLPFPCKIYGAYGYLDPDADCDIVLYSDALGTPIAEKTASIDLNVTSTANSRRFAENFSSPYSYVAGTNIGAVFKPGASNVGATYKTINHASHRAADMWGTSGYGISRASGAFANANSSLDHYYIGLIVGAFDDAASAGGGMLVHPGMGGRLVA